VQILPMHIHVLVLQIPVIVCAHVEPAFCSCSLLRRLIEVIQAHLSWCTYLMGEAGLPAMFCLCFRQYIRQRMMALLPHRRFGKGIYPNERIRIKFRKRDWRDLA
jgi:hypothetical protein